MEASKKAKTERTSSDVPDAERAEIIRKHKTGVNKQLIMAEHHIGYNVFNNIVFGTKACGARKKKVPVAAKYEQVMVVSGGGNNLVRLLAMKADLDAAIDAAQRVDDFMKRLTPPSLLPISPSRAKKTKKTGIQKQPNAYMQARLNERDDLLESWLAAHPSHTVKQVHNGTGIGKSNLYNAARRLGWARVSGLWIRDSKQTDTISEENCGITRD